MSCFPLSGPRRLHTPRRRTFRDHSETNLWVKTTCCLQFPRVPRLTLDSFHAFWVWVPIPVQTDWLPSSAICLLLYRLFITHPTPTLMNIWPHRGSPHMAGSLGTPSAVLSSVVVAHGQVLLVVTSGLS